MPLVKLIRECYTRRPDMISQYSIVKKKYTQWLVQVNNAVLMSVWPMDPRRFIAGQWKYRCVGIETDFVAVARQKNNTQFYGHVISHWWFFKYTEDMFHEVHWGNLEISQQLRVAAVFMKYEMKGVKLWDEGMESLATLEQLTTGESVL